MAETTGMREIEFAKYKSHNAFCSILEIDDLSLVAQIVVEDFLFPLKFLNKIQAFLSQKISQNIFTPIEECYRKVSQPTEERYRKLSGAHETVLLFDSSLLRVTMYDSHCCKII